MQNPDATTSNAEEAQIQDWLKDYIEKNINFDAHSRNDEYLKLRDYVADALMMPVEMVEVPKTTDGGKLYFKLKVMAREERAKDRHADIEFIRMERYPGKDKVRGNALAALDYAKAIMADRPKVTVRRKDGAKFTCCSEAKAMAAIEKNAKYNRYSNLARMQAVVISKPENLEAE